MACVQFIEKNFSKGSQRIIDIANNIIAEYLQDDLRLTLRQLYYQFVSRDVFPDEWIDRKTGSKNSQNNYKRLGSIINDARMAGLIDWHAIEDRGRNLQTTPTWASPEQIIDACAEQFKIDLWSMQPHRVEVWIEKQALEGVIAQICNQFRVPYFSCKGYVSQSEMWDAGYRRLKRYMNGDQVPVILHFGDHDPSGIDMTRDIQERLSLFIGKSVEVRRLALNWEQIQTYNPPPNPAKSTDSRFGGYVRRYGDESWELDALDPHVLVELIRSEVNTLIDNDNWNKMFRHERMQRSTLQRISSRYDDVLSFLNT